MIEYVLHSEAKIVGFVALEPRIVMGVKIASDHSAIRIFIIDFCQKIAEFCRVVGKFDRGLAKFSVRKYKN